MRRTDGQRGFAGVIFPLLIVGVGVSVVLINDTLDYYETQSERTRQHSDDAVLEAKFLVLSYLLLRADNPLDIATGATASVRPRLLMLPCPDNLGDENLDGSQDPSCGAAIQGNNEVGDVLNSGSRFGRLPWFSRTAVENSINDGLNKDIRDAHGNRLWYALSRNMAPRKRGGLPLNFHRLATTSNEWLSVVGGSGQMLSAKAAAVILAPGKGDGARQHESALFSEKYTYDKDAKNDNDRLNPRRYFESVTLTLANDVQIYENYNKDGVFVKATNSGQFNDVVAYIDLFELMKEESYFYRSYEKSVGLSSVQNRPAAARPLGQIRNAVQSYYALFGFYPTPAQQRLPAHTNERARHCADYRSGAQAITGGLTTSHTFLTPAAVLVQTVTVTVTSTPPQTITMTQLSDEAAVLSLDNATLTVVTDVDLGVENRLTLARYARIVLTTGTQLSIVGGQSIVINGRVPVAATIGLLGTATVRIPPRTPLQPPGNLFGWLGEHDAEAQRAGNDNRRLPVAAASRAAFLSGVVLTNAVTTLTLGYDDRFIIAAGGSIRLDQDFATSGNLSGDIHFADGRITTVANVRPTRSFYERRQFAVRLLSDTVTVPAPAVIFPWRQTTSSDTNSRDNLHDYPPCFDSRNFNGRRFRNFLEDQPMLYAVADSCHYGGNPEICGQSAGLTVRIAAGATVALPQATTLTHSFTVSLGADTITVRDGVIRVADSLTLMARADFPLLSGNVTAAILRLPRDYVFNRGATLSVAAGTALIGGDDSRLVNVPALLMYSPRPLRRVACATDMDAEHTVIRGTLTLANQLAENDDITAPCYWLDDEENADGDGEYVIHPPPDDKVVLSNDFFILFGGVLQTP